jgi:hypothetical protein
MITEWNFNLSAANFIGLGLQWHFGKRWNVLKLWAPGFVFYVERVQGDPIDHPPGNPPTRQIRRARERKK